MLFDVAAEVYTDDWASREAWHAVKVRFINLADRPFEAAIGISQEAIRAWIKDCRPNMKTVDVLREPATGVRS